MTTTLRQTNQFSLIEDKRMEVTRIENQLTGETTKWNTGRAAMSEKELLLDCTLSYFNRYCENLFVNFKII